MINLPLDDFHVLCSILSVGFIAFSLMCFSVVFTLLDMLFERHKKK